MNSGRLFEVITVGNGSVFLPIGGFYIAHEWVYIIGESNIRFVITKDEQERIVGMLKCDYNHLDEINCNVRLNG